MAGTRSDYHKVIAMEAGYSAAAVTAGQSLLEFAVPFACRLGGVVARAETAGSGAGSTVLDVQINGSSVWSAPAHRPTLAAGSTGEFTNTDIPEARSLRPLTPVMDHLTLKVVSIPAGAGHARLSLAVALEEPELVPNSIRRTS